MPVNYSKNIVKRVNRKSITLTNGKRVAVKMVINNYSFWLVIR